MHPKVQNNESPKPKRRRVSIQKRHEDVRHHPGATILIAARAYELYSERGYRHGYALDDWLEAEREILSHVPPV